MSQFYNKQKSLSRVGLGKSRDNNSFYKPTTQLSKSSQNKKIAVFFDVDDTLIRGQTQRDTGIGIPPEELPYVGTIPFEREERPKNFRLWEKELVFIYQG